jgi:hypothetical protein
LGSGGIGASDGEVIDLAADEDPKTVEGPLVDISLVGGGNEPESLEDVVDVLFPKCAGFGVALESVKNG